MPHSANTTRGRRNCLTDCSVLGAWRRVYTDSTEGLSARMHRGEFDVERMVYEGISRSWLIVALPEITANS